MIGCLYYDVGFESLQERDNHVRSHNRPFKCPERGCFYEELGFGNNQSLNRHIALCHSSSDSSKFAFPKLPTAGERKRFQEAIKSDNLDLVRELIHANSSLQDGAWIGGYTGLQLAAKHGSVRIAQLLLDCGSNIGTLSKSGTALHVACFWGQADMVQFLLSYSRCEEDVNSKDEQGDTPLLSVFRSQYVSAKLEVVRLLLEDRKVSANIQNRIGRTPLSLAAALNHSEAVPMVMMFLKRDGIDINAKDSGGGTPLSWAASSGIAGVVKIFLQWDGVDVNARDAGGRTPLSWAAYREDSEAVPVVMLLLGHNEVDINARDNEGRTPLAWAAVKRIEGVVKVLLQDRGVDVNARDAGGRTPLSWAAGSGTAAVVDAFLEQSVGVDVNARDDRGRTPLSWAVARRDAGMAAVVKRLEEHGAVCGAL